MPSRNIACLSMLGIFLTLTFSGHLSDAQSTHKFEVHVDVTTKDEDTKSLLQSWIKRELRSLSDVTIVSKDKSMYILNIIAVELVYESGKKIGSIAVTAEFLTKTGYTIGYYYYPYLQLYTDDTRDLEGICKSLVANCDTKVLEPIREIWNKLK